MNIDAMIAACEQQIAGLLGQRSGQTEQLQTLRAQLESGDVSVTAESVDAIVAARSAVDEQLEVVRARLAELNDEKVRDDAAAELARQFGAPAHRSPVTVTSEPEPYRRNGATSYFRDLWFANQHGRRDSIERLVRNDRIVTDKLNERGLTTTDGAGGEFVPPLWMVDEYEKLARAGRVCADRVRKIPLPGGTDSISLPKVSTGTSVAAQGTQNTAVSDTDMASTSTTAAVETLAGKQVVALQLVEQSPINIDEVVLGDLAAAHAVEVDKFVLAANSTNKKGVLNATGINAITFTSGSPTFPLIWPKIIDSQLQVNQGRLLAAQEVWMNPRRWAWFQALLDSSNRPYVSDSLASAIPLAAQTNGSVAEGFAGTIRGLALPVFIDANIPTNLGGGTNEDRIITIRPADVTLFESGVKAQSFGETKADQLSVVFRLYSYCAVMAERAPKAISVISGTGLATPTF